MNENSNVNESKVNEITNWLDSPLTDCSSSDDLIRNVSIKQSNESSSSDDLIRNVSVKQSPQIHNAYRDSNGNEHKSQCICDDCLPNLNC